VGVLAGLEELYLSQNGIKRMEDIANLRNLKVLDLAQNAITQARAPSPVMRVWQGRNPNGCNPQSQWSLHGRDALQVEGLEHQTQLTDLWLNDNPVADLDHLSSALASCTDSLTTLYLENSPASQSKAYLHIMKALLPALEFLDSTQVYR